MAGTRGTPDRPRESQLLSASPRPRTLPLLLRYSLQVLTDLVRYEARGAIPGISRLTKHAVELTPWSKMTVSLVNVVFDHRTILAITCAKEAVEGAFAHPPEGTVAYLTCGAKIANILRGADKKHRFFSTDDPRFSLLSDCAREFVDNLALETMPDGKTRRRSVPAGTASDVWVLANGLRGLAAQLSRQADGIATTGMRLPSQDPCEFFFGRLRQWSANSNPTIRESRRVVAKVQVVGVAEAVLAPKRTNGKDIALAGLHGLRSAGESSRRRSQRSARARREAFRWPVELVSLKL